MIKWQYIIKIILFIVSNKKSVHIYMSFVYIFPTITVPIPLQLLDVPIPLQLLDYTAWSPPTTPINVPH